MSDPEEAKPSERVTAEKARQIATTVLADKRASEAAQMLEYRRLLAQRTREQLEELDADIGATARIGRNWVRRQYEARIARSNNTPDKVVEIKEFADEVSEAIVSDLQGRGFGVRVEAKEELDYRQSDNAQPEYYTHTFHISW